MRPAAIDITVVNAEQLRRRRMAAADHYRVAVAARRGRSSRADEPTDTHRFPSWHRRPAGRFALP
jgi:hypothetical protein